MHRSSRRGRLRLWSRYSLLAVGALALGACDLGVFDPGQIEDSDLIDPEAIPPLVAGVEGEFAFATTGQRPGGTYGAVSFLTDEIVHSGQYVGIRDWSNAGYVPNDVSETSSRWAYASRARWLAETSIDMITEVVQNEGGDPEADPNIAQVTLWAGFSNRVMGETFCNAVINGGSLEPNTAFFERAEDYFTDAVRVASNVGNDSLVTAAYAGRAQVRMMLGDWSGAVSDATQVPTGYVHEVRHSSNASREYNGLHELHLRDTQATVWGTPFAEWGTIVNEAEVDPYRDQLEGIPDPEGDPRVPYRVPIEVDDEGNASYVIGGDQRRPNWEPYKYESRDDNVAVAKGTEMRLIEAEAALRSGNVGAAVDLINEVRAHHGLGDASAGTVEEGWTLLMKERGIELWLEGRRAADLRRWAETPGSVPFEVVRLEASGAPPAEDERRNVLEFYDENGNLRPAGAGLCLPVSENEINSNPHL